ncbi:MAG: class I SAM-dependent methyltransferase [Candidatus Desulfacyla sp.]
MKTTQVFDPWPEKYDQWFETPIGRLIKTCETELVLDMLRPARGERILDAGCGTGVFTREIIEAGARVVGLELSFPMLARAREKLSGDPFTAVQGDMNTLPFKDHSFDKSMSITAIEFIKDARCAVEELFRVTRPGGLIVVATLNRLSPWAKRRRRSGKEGHSLFQDVIFRSPENMRHLSAVPCTCRTAIHFQKDEDPQRAKEIEQAGRLHGLDTGAFLACCWRKPALPGHAR